MGITIVGLGPGPVDQLTLGAREALLDPAASIFVRTALHPVVDSLLRHREHRGFDDLYSAAVSHAAVQEAIAATLIGSVRLGGGEHEVVYAVPGDGVSGEGMAIALEQRGVSPRILAGVSDAPVVLAAAGLRAAGGAQSVDAAALAATGAEQRIELNPCWAAVVFGVYSRQIASDVKLALQAIYPTDTPVVVVRRPGLADERVTRLALSDLDRGGAEFDHLTHVVLAAVAPEIPTGSPHGLRALVARLRSPGTGCPWDLEQTHQSLIPYVIEEAYEVVEAIEGGTSAALMDELGDVLLQVALHAEIADQDGDFDWNDVVRTLSAKLVRRHPHVFGDVEVRGAADVVRNWDQLKAAERTGEPAAVSALEGIPKSLPALKLAAEQSRKAAQAGFAWPSQDAAQAKVREELDELLAVQSLSERQEELGDLLWSLANLATLDGLDPERVLRGAVAKFGRRFRAMEEIALAQDIASLKGRPPSELLELWERAKQAEATHHS